MKWMRLALALMLAPVAACAEDIAACEKAEAAHLANNLDPAIADYTRCLEIGSLSTLNRAIADCDRAVQLQPNEPTPLANRGAAYLRSQNYSRAVADYDAAIKLFAGKQPDRAAETLYGRGIAYSRLEKPDLAAGDFRQAAALDPSIEGKMRKIGLVR
jgi:tetratricopeptide (TPR) repeat protein